MGDLDWQGKVQVDRETDRSVAFFAALIFGAVIIWYSATSERTLWARVERLEAHHAEVAEDG